MERLLLCLGDMDSNSAPAPNTSRELFVGLALILASAWFGYAVAGAMPRTEAHAGGELELSAVRASAPR